MDPPLLNEQQIHNKYYNQLSNRLLESHYPQQIQIYPTLLDNSQISYLQPNSQLPYYPYLDVYPFNEQPGHTAPQSELKPDTFSIRTNRRPKKKEARKTKPYVKRTHSRIACNPCRGARLRCVKEEKNSTSCNRCIEEKRICIFDENPGKRGRKLNSKNKPKEKETKNCDVNAADNIIKVTKPCYHGNNGVISDNLNLKGTSSISSPKIRQTQGGGCTEATITTMR
ncbi:12868_t:CDS:2 [Entrophospora sp. SA101]|nr:12868_t:CDS:2 [Entrophospora sp. SA101]